MVVVSQWTARLLGLVESHRGRFCGGSQREGAARLLDLGESRCLMMFYQCVLL